MKIHTFEQGTEEWFTVRLGKFTASTAQAIATNGRGLETLVFEKVAERLTGKTKPQYTNLDMERGNDLEEEARNAYEIETGTVVKQVGFVEISEWLGASPDGFIGDDGLQEIKCPNDAKFARFMYDGKVEPQYKWQMQMQMLLTKRKYVDYVLYNPNFPKSVIVTKVNADKDAFKKLEIGLKKAEEMGKEVLKKIK